jgi:predicted metalloenzyme YecM
MNDDYGVAPDYQLPDELWEHIKPLLPPQAQEESRATADG